MDTRSNNSQRGFWLSLAFVFFHYFVRFNIKNIRIESVVDLTNGRFHNCSLVNCTFGLLENMQVMEMISAYRPFFYIGIISASLSSALASLISAPKIFQVI